MDQQKSSISGAMKKINIIHKAMLFGPIITGIILYQLGESKDQVPYFGCESPLIAIVAISIICILSGDVLYKKQVSKTITDPTLNKKLQSFKTAYALRISLIKGPAMILSLFYYTTLNLTYLIIAGVLVLYIIALAPTKDKIAMHLNLQGKDKADLYRTP